MKKITFLFGLFLCFSLTVQSQEVIKQNTWYKLENIKSTGKMANDGKKKSGDIMVAKRNIATGGHWKFISNGKGYYKIQNKDSKMYLANFGNNKRGSRIRQTNTPGNGALWQVIQLQGGNVLIQNKASLLFIGIAGETSKTDLVQAKALSSRIVWKPIKVTRNVVVNNGLPRNTNINAFKPKHGGRIAKVVVRYTNQIQVMGEKPRSGQRIYFFPQQLNPANKEGLSFDPKKPKICGETFLIRKVTPRITLNKPMPNMRNRVNDSFMFVVEIY